MHEFAHVIIEQVMFQLIDRLAGFFSHLLEPNPNQNGTPDMVALTALQTALTHLQARHLLEFAMRCACSIFQRQPHTSCVVCVSS